jgi:hypothetical protein
VYYHTWLEHNFLISDFFFFMTFQSMTIVLLYSLDWPQTQSPTARITGVYCHAWLTTCNFCLMMIASNG